MENLDFVSNQITYFNTNKKKSFETIQFSLQSTVTKKSLFQAAELFLFAEF